VFGAVIIAILFVSIPTPTPPLSLKVQRYGVTTSADGGQLVCYLMLTNASKNSYRLFLNGTNALGSDGSVMISCEYSAETTNGWTNRTDHLFAPITTIQFPPRASLVVRVPAPYNRQALKVAALCVEVPRQLPPILDWARRRIWWRITRPQATYYKAWCDQELFRENPDQPK
jgi:hypothetical protein